MTTTPPSPPPVCAFHSPPSHNPRQNLPLLLPRPNQPLPIPYLHQRLLPTFLLFTLSILQPGRRGGILDVDASEEMVDFALEGGELGFHGCGGGFASVWSSLGWVRLEEGGRKGGRGFLGGDGAYSEEKGERGDV